MNHPQFFLNQQVTYKNMPNDPLTLLTITDIQGTSITARLPGGAYITADQSAFQKYTPPKDSDEKSDFESEKRPFWNPRKKSFKKK